MTDKCTHTSDCDWHVDQYPWECTCGAIPKKQAMDDLIAQDADFIDIEPVAYRYGFDGYGWQYIDNGSGSDWAIRHPDAEPLYAHSPADRIEALEAEVERLRDVIDVIWVEASTMRNARKLIGPYPTQPEKNRIWARSVCHIGKRLMEIIQPIRAKLGEKQ